MSPLCMHYGSFISTLVASVLVLGGVAACGPSASSTETVTAEAGKEAPAVACDADRLRTAAAAVRTARNGWSPKSGDVFDGADKATNALLSACSEAPDIVKFAVVQTANISELSERSDGYPQDKPPSRPGSWTPYGTLEQAHWDAVAPQLCPNLVALSTAGLRLESLYRDCGLSSSHGLSEADFVNYSGSIVTVALLKTQRWLEQQSDSATAEVLTQAMLERWTPLRMEVRAGNLKLPSAEAGEPIPMDAVLVHVSPEGVWVRSHKVSTVEDPQLATLLSETVRSKVDASTDRNVAVVASRDLSAEALTPVQEALKDVGVDKLQLVVLADDVQRPLRTVVVQDELAKSTDTIQQLVR